MPSFIMSLINNVASMVIPSIVQRNETCTSIFVSERVLNLPYPFKLSRFKSSAKRRSRQRDYEFFVGTLEDGLRFCDLCLITPQEISKLGLFLTFEETANLLLQKDEDF